MPTRQARQLSSPLLPWRCPQRNTGAGRLSTSWLHNPTLSVQSPESQPSPGAHPASLLREAQLLALEGVWFPRGPYTLKSTRSSLSVHIALSLIHLPEPLYLKERFSSCDAKPPHCKRWACILGEPWDSQCRWLAWPWAGTPTSHPCSETHSLFVSAV